VGADVSDIHQAQMVADCVALECAGAKMMTLEMMKTSERKNIRVFIFRYSWE
jgi:hypothetical protein